MTKTKGTKLYFKLLGGFALLLIMGWGFSFVGGTLSTAGKIVSAPQRVLNKALETDNIVHKYEWFHDTYAAYNARLKQVIQFSDFYNNEEDKGEKRRLRMEMAAQSQSCRDTATKYNANSEKLNVGVFKGWSLPDKLNVEVCSS